MDTELEDNPIPERVEDDKTRQLVVPIRGAVIDDLSAHADSVASPLPPLDVSPFADRAVGGGREAPRAAPPTPRSVPLDIATKVTNPSSLTVGDAPARATAGMPKLDVAKPPIAPPPLVAREPEGPTGPESSPTIVVKEIVHQPSPRRLQREATVVVRRAVRRSRRSPAAVIILCAVVIFGGAVSFAVVKRYRENRAKDAEIQRRIEAIRRSDAH